MAPSEIHYGKEHRLCAIKSLSWAHLLTFFSSIFLSLSLSLLSNNKWLMEEMLFGWIICKSVLYKIIFYDIIFPSLLYHCISVWIYAIIPPKSFSVTCLFDFTFKATMLFSDEAICPLKQTRQLVHSDSIIKLHDWFQDRAGSWHKWNLPLTIQYVLSSARSDRERFIWLSLTGKQEGINSS